MIQYKVVKRKNPLNPEEAKYYPQIVSRGYVDLDTLAERISAVCTVTKHDVLGVLTALESHIIAALQDGNSVCMGYLGSFHLRVKSVRYGQTSADDVTADDVERLHVNFTKSSHLRKTFVKTNNRVQFNKIV